MIYITERIYNDGPTKNFKLLGVLIDKYLLFEDHIDNLCTKISKLLFCIKRIKNFINQDSMKTLYYAIIHSHLVSCINIYSCTTDTFLNKLKLKQKESIRTICNAGYRDHTAPLFAQLKYFLFLSSSNIVHWQSCIALPTKCCHFLSVKCGHQPTEIIIQVMAFVTQTIFRNIFMLVKKVFFCSISLKFGTMKTMHS